MRETKEDRKENMAFRYFYAFGVLFVVLSHCDGGGIEMLSNWMHFGAFHVSIFVFGSGYFFRREAVKTPLSYVWKKVYGLLVPLWLIHFVYGLVLIVLHRLHFTFGEAVSLKAFLIYPITSRELFTLDLAAWFVFPFFMVQMIYLLGKTILDTLEHEKVTDMILQIFMLASGLLGVYCSTKGIAANEILIRIAYFMPFYILGMWYREYAEQKLQRLSSAWILAACLITALILNTRFGRVVYAIPSECDYPFGLFATYLSAVIGILFWLIVSGELAKADENIRILKLIGNHTWSIMFHQFAGMLLVKTLFAIANLTFGWFADFDLREYYGNVWYLYLPKGIEEFKMLYVVGAIGFSVFVHQIYMLMKRKITCSFLVQKEAMPVDAAVSEG